MAHKHLLTLCVILQTVKKMDAAMEEQLKNKDRRLLQVCVYLL